MKTRILFTISLLILSISAFAVDSTLEVKGGVQYPMDLEKVGFDSAVTLNIGVDKYFTVGAETGFGWLNWEEKVGASVLGNLPLTEKSQTNLYTLPLLAVARIRLADMMQSYGFMPFLTGGAGYAWTWYTLPENTYRFSGFTWQALVGAEIKLGSESNLSLVVEAGYRGSKLTNVDDKELNMSGYVGRVGISFPLETSSDESDF